MDRPLADRIRPQTLEEVVGQRHLLGPDALLRRFIEKGTDANMVFYGPSGTGKTTIANIVAARTNKTLYRLNATTASLQDIKEYCRLCRLEESEENLRARYQIIKKQQEQAHRRAAEAKAAADYIDYKVQHYEDILAGLAPDDMNPGSWGQGKQGE